MRVAHSEKAGEEAGEEAGEKGDTEGEEAGHGVAHIDKVPITMIIKWFSERFPPANDKLLDTS